MFDYFLLLAFFFGLVAVLLIALHDLKWGVILIPALLPTYLLRASITWIPTTFLELALYLVLAVALWRLFVFLKHSFLPKRTFLSLFKTFWSQWKWLNFLILVLFVAAVMGTLISDSKQLSLGILKSWFFDPILYFYLVIFVLNKLSDWRKIFYLMILPAVLISGYGLIQYLTGDLASDNRVRAIFESPNYVSLYFGPLMMILLGLVLDQLFLKRGKRKVLLLLGLLASFGLLLLVLILTQSYAAWLAITLGSLFVIGLIPCRRWLYYLLLLGGALLGFATQLNNPKLPAILSMKTPSSMHKRVEIWRVSLRMIREHWFEGIGLGKFQDLYSHYVQLLFKRPLELSVLHTHNLFLMFWVNLGIFGFLAFLGILVWFFATLIKLAKDHCFLAKIRLEYFVFLGMMVTILVHGFLDTPYWKNDLAFLFWIAIAGIAWLRNWQIARH